MKKTNKKPLAFLMMIAAAGVVGGAFAYFTSDHSFENIFKGAVYETTFTEEFDGPANWLPGQTTTKTATVKNDGNVPVAVRVKLTETWAAADGTTVLGTIDVDGDQGEATEKAALIQGLDTTNWELKDDGYYYYKKALKAKTDSLTDETTSIITGVKLNEKAANADTCTPVKENGVTTVTCTSTGAGYDEATYTLKLDFETVQFDAYANYWSTDVAISNE